MRTEQRVTLILAANSDPAIDRVVGRRGAFLTSIEALRAAMRASTRDDGGLDVERIVIDRSVTARDFLDFLAAVPTAFLGDVIFIGDDGTAFLSATARGGGRVLYTLAAHDVRFYLETHGLIARRPPGLMPSEARA